MVKALLCFGMAVACFMLPEYVGFKGAAVGPSSPDMRTMSGYAVADALRNYEHPEDEFCCGATPDCPSHWEAWNSLPPTMD